MEKFCSDTDSRKKFVNSFSFGEEYSEPKVYAAKR